MLFKWLRFSLFSKLYKTSQRRSVSPLKFFKSCLPQILLGLFLNTLSHLAFAKKKRNKAKTFADTVLKFSNNIISWFFSNLDHHEMS